MSEPIICRATRDHVPGIREIYNEAILHTTATFDVEPKTLEERMRWFDSHTDRYPIWVALLDDQVVGWACLSRWSDRCAYDDTAETSFYVASAHRGKGIGRKLKQHTVTEARRLGYHSLIARVAEGSDASLHLNLEAGFQLVGTLRQVGMKFGRRLDVTILQLLLNG